MRIHVRGGVDLAGDLIDELSFNVSDVFVASTKGSDDDGVRIEIT